MQHCNVITGYCVHLRTSKYKEMEKYSVSVRESSKINEERIRSSVDDAVGDKKWNISVSFRACSGDYERALIFYAYCSHPEYIRYIKYKIYYTVISFEILTNICHILRMNINVFYDWNIYLFSCIFHESRLEWSEYIILFGFPLHWIWVLIQKFQVTLNLSQMSIMLCCLLIHNTWVCMICIRFQ